MNKILENLKSSRTKIISFTILGLGIALVIAYAIVRLTLYVNSNEFVWKFPVVVTTQRVLTITPRVTTVVQNVVIPNYPEDIDTDLEKYICEKWGLMDCKMALAIASAESGLRCNAVNINDNNTADLGVFQLNTVHLKKGGDWTLANMGDCYKNVDLAYEMWKEQGWNPWVAYLNGTYLAKY